MRLLAPSFQSISQVVGIVLPQGIWGIRDHRKAAVGKKNTCTACRACSVQRESNAKPARAGGFF
ncbi:MAG: hypothetical protein JRF45_09220 [Deltaproteobacteria bacterium]|nr:hypothetical protein [Deltaproteobacteria bacterium]MBW1968772.1 hypothetical protein [Deltaproteobacteria bacterium]MBW2155839.1 hypothetical protein [Deltaproteobacteria bacterium]MBW2198903.1 hypothetical protein [Deltaproteobacteria bacterium]MBW2326649.1 hypothetical protein [Deltaproteobacteria bacterium]